MQRLKLVRCEPRKTRLSKNRSQTERGSDMKFGSDLWEALKFLIALLKLIIEMFGDGEDKENLKKNDIKV
ncbi:hypothetical protein ES703_23630 [subsurface metagenome]